MSLWYSVEIMGCDDHTVFAIELEDETAVALLDRLAVASRQVSTYGCMPRMHIKQMDGPPPAPVDEYEDEMAAYPIGEE